MSAVVPHILYQHFEDASFLWMQRERAVRSPQYNLTKLARLDERLDAHLDGLVEAGDAAWQVADELGTEEPGAVFRDSFLAFHGGDRGRIGAALDAGAAEEEFARAITAALARLPFERVSAVLDALAGASDTARRRIGLAGHLAHRRDPGKHLDLALRSNDPRLRARALRGIAELGCTNLQAALLVGLHDRDESCRFEAARAGAILHTARVWLDALRAFAISGSRHAVRALKVLVRRLGGGDARALVEELRRSGRTTRLAIVAAGIAGDPASVPWLLETMASPKHGRIAGAAFTQLTGLLLEKAEGLVGAPPTGFDAFPNDDPDDDRVEPDPDDQLPWPEPAAVGAWWKRHAKRFGSSGCHLLGSPARPDWCRQVLRHGRQPHRFAAALELAMAKPGSVLFEVRAPGFVQQLAL